MKLDDEAPTAALALKSGFEWTQTGEGRHFWGAVWQALDLRAELPEFDVLARKHLDLATMHRPYCPCIHCDRHREAVAALAREYSPETLAEKLATLADDYLFDKLTREELVAGFVDLLNEAATATAILSAE